MNCFHRQHSAGDEMNWAICDNYARLAALAAKEGQYSLKLKLEEQAADEGEHAQEMTRLLG